MIRRQLTGVIELDLELGRIFILRSGKILAHGDLQVAQDVVNTLALKIPIVGGTDLNTGIEDLGTDLF